MQYDYEATARAIYPEVKDPVTGKVETIRVIIRHLSLSWSVEGHKMPQSMRATQTVRQRQDRYTVELLSIPFSPTVSWAPTPPPPSWKKLGETMSRSEFHSFLSAQGLPASGIIHAMDMAQPTKREPDAVDETTSRATKKLSAGAFAAMVKRMASV